MSNPVRTLTTAIASGDTEALAVFYRQWFDYVFAQARRASGRDEQFCLDVVQETMMRVIRSLTPMDNEAGLRKWLAAVVRSCCYDELRRQMRRRRREQARSDAQPIAENSNDELQARLAWLREQMISIDPELAHLLALRFRMGWTLQRIGQALGLKPGAVDGRIARCLAELRAKGQEDFHE